MHRRNGLGVVLLFAAVAACSRLPGRDRPSVVLITLDTLRADHVGCYGHDRRITPHIDRFAREGVLFADALVAIPETAPSIRSILTGLYPVHHDIRRNGYDPDPNRPTMQSLLGSAGYRTAAFTSSCVLDRASGFGDGFDRFNDRTPDRFLLREHGQRTAEKTADAALGWLSTRDEGPFFLWIHFIDPHSLYNPPPPYKSFFQERPCRGALTGGADQFLDVIKHRLPIGPEERKWLADRYDGEIAFLDHQIGRLLDGLENLAPENTLVVLTADHGESLGDHGYLFDHGDFLYEDQIRVPLLLSHPDLPRGLVVGGQVESVDILPTVLDFVRLDLPKERDGASLLPALRGDEAPGRLALSESDGCDGGTMRPHRASGLTGKLFGVRDGRWKYVTDFSGWEELYDLETDPGETTDLSRRESERGETMRRALRERIGPSPWGDEEPLAPATREKLRALGYVD